VVAHTLEFGDMPPANEVWTGRFSPRAPGETPRDELLLYSKADGVWSLGRYAPGADFFQKVGATPGFTLDSKSYVGDFAADERDELLVGSGVWRVASLS